MPMLTLKIGFYLAAARCEAVKAPNLALDCSTRGHAALIGPALGKSISAVVKLA